MNNSTINDEKTLFSENIGQVVLFIFILVALTGGICLFCVWVFKKVLKDIHSNTLRINSKQIPFSHQHLINEKIKFQAMAVNTFEENQANTNGVDGHESIDLKKIQEEMYKKEEQETEHKKEMVSTIDINLADISVS